MMRIRMKKIFFVVSVFFLLSFILYLSSFPLFAQEVQQAQNKKCLAAAQNGGQTTTPPNPVTLTVTGKGFPSGKNIDIEFCPPGGPNTKTQCEIMSSVIAQGGSVKAQYTLSGLSGHVKYPFYGIWPYEQTTGTAGEGGAQKQGTFTFEQNDENCQSILWDPLGRVFDSQSLEPIPNITVSVLNTINPDELSQIVNNPQTVKNDGAFNFLIEPGTYFLKVAAPFMYSFSAKPNLNLNYAKAYSKRDGSLSIYKPNESIVEKAGMPEHRDIPLDPGKNSPSHFLVVNMPGNYEQMVFGSQTKYGGKISHPLSIVALVGSKTKKEIARTTADKFGYWGILLDNMKVPQNEALVVKLIKVDLTTGIADENNGRVTNDITFEPILRIVQGYVYNSSGVVIPNATVQIYREGKNKTYYQTTADENGYFSIQTNNLPDTSYYVVSKTPTGSVAERVSTSAFAERNASYLSKNDLNLMQTKTKTFMGSNQENNIPPLNTVSTGVEQEKKQNFLPLLLVVLLLLGVVATGTFLFYSSGKKRRK